MTNELYSYSYTKYMRDWITVMYCSEHWEESRNVQFCVWDSNRQHISPVRVPHAELNISAPPRDCDWVIKGLGMSSLVYVTGHIKDPVPLIEKRRGLSPGGRFPPSFIHPVIIISGLNKLYNRMFSP